MNMSAKPPGISTMPARGGVIAKEGLDEFGNQDGGRSQNKSDDELQHHGSGEAGVSQQWQIDDRILDDHGLPDDQPCDTEHRQYGEDADEIGGEPVIFLAFVEQNLESAEAEHDKGEADVIDADSPRAGALGFLDGSRRILHEVVGEK